ncbi:MAG TPA: DUF2267 domain-containing protein [Planctomycetota bacterium]|nr:DUF2267 domain-containing protein [Planctomycetota bacterium]
MTTNMDVFERSIQKAGRWIDDLERYMGWENPHQTYEALGVVLHVLRDRIPVHQAVAFGAQLPLLLRGLYFQNWDVSKNPEKYRHARDFLAHVRDGLAEHRLEFVPEERLVEGVVAVISQRISEGEYASLRRSLPAEVRRYFGEVSIAPQPRKRWITEERAWDKFSS